MNVMATGTSPWPAAQHTLSREVGCDGVGLHSGHDISLTLKPALAGHGIVFRRTDVGTGDPLIPARWDRVCDTRFATTIANGEGLQVGTIEHLVAALAGCAVDNVLIEIDGAEVPVMDGSSRPFVELIERTGTRPQQAARRALRILRPVSVSDGDRMISVVPADEFSIALSIEFDAPAIGESALNVRLDGDLFNKTISAARTFAMVEEIDTMKAASLARGGSLENAIVVDGSNILNVGGLRYPDEFVRHKILDCFGDLYLANGPMLGRVTAYKSGHEFNNRLLQAIFAESGNWTWVPLRARPVPNWHRAASLAAG